MPSRGGTSGRATKVALSAGRSARTLDGVEPSDRSRRSRRRVLAAACLALVLVAGSPGLAHAAVNRGECSGPSRWRLAAVPDGGVLLIRLTVRGGRAGQRWNVFMDHNGTGFFAGHRISGEDGFWIVRKRVANRAGLDRIRFGAHNVVTGETCQGRVVV
jgi:hypothetical protein